MDVVRLYRTITGGLYIMDVKKVIKQIMTERNIDYIELAKKMDMQPQSLRTKIYRGNYSLSDFIEIMDILECDLQVQTRDTKKIFY